MFLITFEKNSKKNRPNEENRKTVSNINFIFVKKQVEFRNHLNKRGVTENPKE